MALNSRYRTEKVTKNQRNMKQEHEKRKHKKAGSTKRIGRKCRFTVLSKIMTTRE